MIAAIRTEITKLNRSLALLLCAAAPTMVAVLCAMMFAQSENDRPWMALIVNGAALWSFFMLPMTVAALTVLIAQLEHGPRFWNHLLALPVPRWHIFAAKMVVVLALLAGMSALLFLLLPAAVALADWMIESRKLVGAFEPAAFARLLGQMYAGAILLTMIQLWAALHFRSFVPPLVLGIGGTFVAVAATSSEYGPYFPWLIPTNALATDPARAELALGIGLWGGLVLGAAMLVHLSRREAV